jgi:hypothetical protein
MQGHRVGRRQAACPGLAHTCGHDFIMSEAPVFTGTEGARSCASCDRVDVLIDGHWVTFEDYLEKRRAAADAAE